MRPPPPVPASMPTRALGRPMTVGACVPTAFSAWARSAPAFALVSLVYQLPVNLLLRLAPSLPRSDWGAIAVSIVAMVLPFLAWNLTLGAVTFGVLEGLSGRRATVRRCLGVSFRTFGPLFGISLRMLVHLLLWGALAGMAGAVLSAFLPSAHTKSNVPPPATIAILGGVVGLTVLWYLSRYAISGPVAVVERLDHWYSMDRSRQLSRGRRLAVAATYFLVGAPAVALSVGTFLVAPDLAGAPRGTGLWSWIGTGVDELVSGPLIGTAVAVVYHALRRERDGVDAEELARVFE